MECGVDNCDFEADTRFDTQTLVMLDGDNVSFDNCQFRVFNASVYCVDSAAAYSTGAWKFDNCKFEFSNTVNGVDYASWVSKSRSAIDFDNCKLNTAKFGTGHVSAHWFYYPLMGNYLNTPDLTRRPRPKFIEHGIGSALQAAWTKAGSGTAVYITGVAGGALELETGATLNQDVTLNFNGIKPFILNKFANIWFDITLSSNTKVQLQIGLRDDANNYAMIVYDPDVSANFVYDSCLANTHTTGNLWPHNTTKFHFMIEMCRGQYDGANTYTKLVFHIDNFVGGYNRVEVTTNLPTTYLEPYIHLKTTDANTKKATINMISIEEDN
jgi:hypothetical protein